MVLNISDRTRKQRAVPTHYRLLTPLERKAFENIVGKGENAGDQHFLLFPQCFLLFLKQISIFEFTFILSSAIAFSLDQSIILLFGEELKSEGTGRIIPRKQL